MKHLKRALSVLLVLCLIFALSVPAFAAKNYKKYETYMCIGDSIAAGCALSRLHPGTDTEFDTSYAESDPARYAADLAYMYSPTCEWVYRGYAPERVPYAYHSIVADTLGVDEFVQGARSGMRAIEFRYMLTGEYSEPDETYAWGNSFFDMDGNGFGIDDLNTVNEQYKFADGIKKADLITINLGSNDVLSPTFSNAFSALSADISDPEIEEAAAALREQGNIGLAFSKLLEAYQALGKLSVVVETLRNEFVKNMAQFRENYDAVVRAIYKLNPDVTIVGVSTYNFFQDFHLSKDASFEVSTIAAPFVNDINSFIKSYQNKYSGRYYYANVVGTQTYEIYYDDPHMWDYWIFEVHPTIAGHQLMADRILGCLPAQADANPSFFSFFTTWFKNLIHFSDILDILFSWLPILN